MDGIGGGGKLRRIGMGTRLLYMSQPMGHAMRIVSSPAIVFGVPFDAVTGMILQSEP